VNTSVVVLFQPSPEGPVKYRKRADRIIQQRQKSVSYRPEESFNLPLTGGIIRLSMGDTEPFAGVYEWEEVLLGKEFMQQLRQYH
jgi:hypothetical protein